jgi:hypothetical protein
MGRLSLPVLMMLILVLVWRAPGYAQRGNQAAPAAKPAPPAGGCPGERMGVQATGVYQNRPVEGVVINGKPWGGAYWEAGMRSYWHCHAGGQLMMVYQGVGRVQKRGERIRVLSVGDTEYAGPWQEHWHGAAPDSPAQYLQVSFEPGETLWMEEVGRDDYLGNDIGITTRQEFLRTGVRKQPEQPQKPPTR